jgi:hypothetical protein
LCRTLQTLFGDGAFREAFATRYIDHIRSFALLPESSYTV